MRPLGTNNYLIKNFLFSLVGERRYNRIKLWKHILDCRLGLPFEISSLFRYFLSGDSIVLDVGANVGQFACRLHKVIGKGNGRIFSFEPESSNLQSLERMKRTLDLRNVTIVPKAVSNFSGDTVLHIPQFDHGLIVATRSTLLNIDGIKHRSQVVEATTIDAFVAGNKITRVDFIKCDTEGNEVNVLEGGRETIQKYLPILSFEMSHKNSQINWLKEIGYQLFFYDKKFKKLQPVNGEQRGNLIFVHQLKLSELAPIIYK